MMSLEKHGVKVRMRNGTGSVTWAKNRLMRGMENTTPLQYQRSPGT